MGKRDNDPAVDHLRPGRGLTISTGFPVKTCGASDWVASRLAARTRGIHRALLRGPAP